MQTVTLSQIQKNISLLGQIKEPLRIFDGRKKRTIATVYPNTVSTKKSIVDELAGSMSDVRHLGEGLTYNEIRNTAKNLHYQDKYGIAPRR